MQVVSSSDSPQHSDQVSLEVALLKSATAEAPLEGVTLVVSADVDVRTYVSDALGQIHLLDVTAVGSVASALDSAARSTPRLIVASDADRAVLRHFPAVPAVLLSDEVPPAETMDARLAPLVVLRGAVASQRLIEVATSLLAWSRENVADVAATVSGVANLKDAT